MKIRDTKLIDTVTGEIMSSTQVKVDYFDDEKGYLLFAKKNYSRVFSDIRIPEQFSDAELGKIYRLQEYIQQSTNLLIVRTKRGYKPMAIEEIIKVTGLTDRYGKEFVSKLISKKLIARVTIEVGDKSAIHYYFNPMYFHNDRRLSVDLYNKFKDEIDPYIKDWVRIAFGEAKELADNKIINAKIVSD